MAESESLEDAIKDLATAPRVFETDGQKVQEHDIRSLIEADKYLDQKTKAKAGQSNIRVQRVRKTLW